MSSFVGNKAGFHNYVELDLVSHSQLFGVYKDQYTYTFHNHFHPFVGELIERLNKKSIDGLLDSDFHQSLETFFFDTLYEPNDDERTVKVESFAKQIDLSERGAYSVYNWELFFHIPLTIAVHLSKNQRFEQAQRWFHYIFNPTAGDGRFWRFLAFTDEDSVKHIDELLRVFSLPEDETTGEQSDLKQLILSGYEAMRKNPFQPHAIARTRFLAYRYSVVMKYLDNLIAWGDALFRQDTMESLEEATQIYVLAANLLGPKPERVPPSGKVRPKTFAQLRAGGLDTLGNALVELEGQFPFNLYHPPEDGMDTDRVNPLFGIGRTLYFCIPQNDQLLAYWDTVADRLFKIRHCMNIEGVVRQLPLFEPPIDPGMLVKAAAAGIDVSHIVSGLNQPQAPVRSQLLINKALDICNEVRSMGAALLSALEKQDNESIALLRQRHEIEMGDMSQEVSFMQWKATESVTESLMTGREVALEQYHYYQRLLGGEDGGEVTQLSLDRYALTEENFDQVYSDLVEQYAVEVEQELYPSFDVKEEGKLYLNENEYEELNVALPEARNWHRDAYRNDILASALHYIPNFKIDASPWGVGADTEVTGGQFFGHAAQAISNYLRMKATAKTHEGAVASKTALYERRADEWRFHKNLAARELMTIGKQIITSLIQEQVAQYEYEQTKLRINQAQEVDAFLKDKFTNEQLYGWMQGELSKLYYEYYKFAFDVAQKAEHTMKHELMRSELDEKTFVKFNYWDGGRKGLLSGEALHLDLKRMDMAYHDHNRREYELTKSISLRQLNPVALLQLKAIGSCEVTVPEWLFDLDCPGHYMRRIKNVQVTIPAVTGPYTSVNCTLSLLRSTLRRSSVLRNDTYARAIDEEDDRFIDYFGTVESIVTSHAREDGGMFETDLRDERFLPFEGAGAISTWRLELPEDFRQFDYDTISDVIIHLRYTARSGGSRLKQKASEQLQQQVDEASESGLTRLFRLKHDFSTEWYQFSSRERSAGGDEKLALTFTIEKGHFPYFVQSKELVINDIYIHRIDGNELESAHLTDVNVNEMTAALRSDGAYQLSIEETELLDRKSDADIFMTIAYTLT